MIGSMVSMNLGALPAKQIAKNRTSRSEMRSTAIDRTKPIYLLLAGLPA